MNTKHFIIIVIVIFALVIGLALSYNKNNIGISEDYIDANLDINPTYFDWGEIPLNKKAITEVTLSNPGTSNIEILKITTSCSCTSAKFVDQQDLDSRIIEPGETAVIEVTFDPLFHEDQELGPITREVYIKTTAPDQEEVTIRFEGIIVDSNS